MACPSIQRATLFWAISALLCLNVAASTTSPKKKRSITIYTYDSMAGPKSFGAYLSEQFEKSSGASVRLHPVGDAGELLNRALLEGTGLTADILLGFDCGEQSRLTDHTPPLLQAYKPLYLQDMKAEFQPNDRFFALPFDYGPYAFIYDSSVIKDPPQSMAGFLNERTAFRKRVLLQDPRTSSPGFGLLQWVRIVSGANWTKSARQLSTHALAVTSGWDAAYGMFLKGEAPVVFSYLSSVAYHHHTDKTDQYQAMLFSEGHLTQVECVGITSRTRSLSLAKEFVDFLISRKVQEEIPLRNWMFPVNTSVRLPESFRRLPSVRLLLPPTAPTGAERAEWIAEWMDAFKK